MQTFTLHTVKLAIASGKIYFTSIGDPRETSYYIITGRPVWDAKYAESLCRYIKERFFLKIHVLNKTLDTGEEIF